MDSNDRLSVDPVAAPRPGEVIAEYLDHYGWSQRDLARCIGLAPKTIGVFFNGKASVTASTALSLERVFRRTAHLWLNLQRQFDEAEARRQEHTQSIEWEDWSRTFPLAEMEKSGFSLQRAKSDVDMLLSFLGVSSPESWEEVWKNHDVAYRQTRQFSTSIASISAWVRETELVAADIVTEDFKKELLRSLFGEFRGVRCEPSKEAAVRAQCIGQGVGVTAVVLGIGGRMAVPEAVELFRIERMDGEAALHHRLDHGSVRNLDGHANGVSLGTGPGQDSVGQRTQAGAATLESPVAQKRAVDVDNGCLVIAGPPVDADEEFDF